MVWEKVPYSNLHNLDLDWIVSKITDIDTAKEESASSAEAAKASEIAAKESETAAKASETAAAESAASADANATNIQESSQLIRQTAARVDNILVQGTPTEGNAELIDIRVAADGTTYTLAGDAVRAQVTDLQNQINERVTTAMFATGYEVEQPEYTVGYLSSADGSTRTDIRRGIFTDYIPYADIMDVVTDSDVNTYRFALYDSNRTFQRMYYSSLDNQTYAYARAFIVPRRTGGNSEATESEIENLLATTFIVTRSALESAYVRKKGVNEVKYANIDPEAIISEENITSGYAENTSFYASSGNTVGSVGTYAGMARAFFSLNGYSNNQRVRFGFDPDATYYNNTVLCIGETAEIGTTRVAYFTKNNVLQNYNGMFDTSDLDVSGTVIIDIKKLKNFYPASVGFFINIPMASWHLSKVTISSGKTLHWLRGFMPAIIVAADGSGDYTTISEAVEAASNDDTIYIKDGDYKESVIVNKYVHLIGQSMQGVTLYNNVGDYDHAPLLITQGSVHNMTIKSLRPSNTSSLTDYAYGIHLDKHFAGQARYQKCEIANCYIYSEVNDAIGAGTNYATQYIIHDCVLEVSENPVKATACGFKCHNGQYQTSGSVELRNNVIKARNADGSSCYDILMHNGGVTNTQPVNLFMTGNVLKYYHNGITNIFVPDPYNANNTVPEMNEIN